MDFGIFYEIQVDSPLKHRGREYDVFHQVLEQVPFAEKNGFGYFWTVEHHFQPGFAHASAPEVLYGAISQLTTTMRICHGVVLLPYPYNHPVPVAERIATLDILSKGRVEVGTGRSSTVQELGGFGIPPDETRARWDEGLRILLQDLDERERHLLVQGALLRHPGADRRPDADPEAAPPALDGLKQRSHTHHRRKNGARPAHAGGRDAARRSREAHPDLRRRGEGPGADRPRDQQQEIRLLHGPIARRPTNRRAPTQSARSCRYISVAGQNAARLKAPTAAAGQEKDAPSRPGFDFRDKVDTSEFTMDYVIDNRTVICGSPDTCIRQIEEITKVVKVDQLMLMKQFWAMPHEHTMKSIELFGKPRHPALCEAGRAGHVPGLDRPGAGDCGTADRRQNLGSASGTPAPLGGEAPPAAQPTGGKRMQFGAFLLMSSPSARSSEELYRRGTEVAQAADDLGFHNIWLAEHHFSTYGYLSRPLIYALHLAHKTRRIRVGTAVIVAPSAPPPGHRRGDRDRRPADRRASRRGAGPRLPALRVRAPRPGSAREPGALGGGRRHPAARFQRQALPLSRQGTSGFPRRKHSRSPSSALILPSGSPRRALSRSKRRSGGASTSSRVALGCRSSACASSARSTTRPSRHAGRPTGRA